MLSYLQQHVPPAQTHSLWMLSICLKEKTLGFICKHQAGMSLNQTQLFELSEWTNAVKCSDLTQAKGEIIFLPVLVLQAMAIMKISYT